MMNISILTPQQIEQKKAKDIAEYKAIAKRYNQLVLKGKMAKNEVTQAAIVKRIEPIAAELEAKVAYMKKTYPKLIAQ